MIGIPGKTAEKPFRVFSFVVGEFNTEGFTTTIAKVTPYSFITAPSNCMVHHI
jgi:hypothetical protein